MNSLSLLQQGLFFYSGTGSAWFGDTMPDEEGNLVMVFDFSNATTNPESAYVSRRVTFPNGSFHDNGLVLFNGGAGAIGRWGDFEATSFDGPGSNHIWVAAQHATSTGDWATGIGKVAFNINQP
jgi:hypothetical protein